MCINSSMCVYVHKIWILSVHTKNWFYYTKNYMATNVEITEFSNFCKSENIQTNNGCEEEQKSLTWDLRILQVKYKTGDTDIYWTSIVWQALFWAFNKSSEYAHTNPWSEGLHSGAEVKEMDLRNKQNIC